MKQRDQEWAQLNVRVPKQLFDQIQATAEREYESQSSIVRRWIRDGLKRANEQAGA